MKLPKLYGKDKAGKTKTWYVTTYDNTLSITFGQQGGKMQTKKESIKGVNVGRSNETTDKQQAELEALSRWNKQLDRGYRETVEELSGVGISAMLAQDYTKKPHLITYPCMISRKLDGVRCLAIKENGVVKLQSRGNKEFSVPHISEALDTVMKDGDTLDGELYIDRTPLQDIVSAVKKSNDNTPFIKYILFDLVNPNIYTERYKELVSVFGGRHKMVSVTTHFLVEDEQHMKAYHKQFVGEGYEGVMLRNLNGKYESGKRSNDLLKYKEFQDFECKILDAVEDRNGNGVFVVYDDIAGGNFNCTYGSFEERKNQLLNKEDYIGMALTVKYQSRYKDTLLPQFPTGVTIRDGVWQNNVFTPSV
jgi:DNA ligase-1